MTTSMPVLTPEDRAISIEKAKAARQERAQFKQDLRSGEKTFEDAFALRKERIAGGIKVIDLIQTIPKIGKKKLKTLWRKSESPLPAA